MKSTSSALENTTDSNLDDMLTDNPSKTVSTCDASTQVAFEPVESVQFSFECSFENQNVTTQVTFPNVCRGFYLTGTAYKVFDLLCSMLP